jgi:hypothetical protein
LEKKMLNDFRFHHIGYAVGSIAATAQAFVSGGYHAGDVIKDDVQQTLICFLEKQNHPRIELVEPASETASVNKILTTGGGGGIPYHLCYEAGDIDHAFYAMLADKWTPLFRPV